MAAWRRGASEKKRYRSVFFYSFDWCYKNKYEPFKNYSRNRNLFPTTFSWFCYWIDAIFISIKRGATQKKLQPFLFRHNIIFYGEFISMMQIFPQNLIKWDIVGKNFDFTRFPTSCDACFFVQRSQNFSMKI